MSTKFKMSNKIHKTIFVYFDEFGAILASGVIDSLLSRLGSAYKSYLRAIKPEVVKIVLDEFYAPELQTHGICSKNSVDIFFIFNLLKPGNQAEHTIEHKLHKCQEAIADIKENTFIQGSYFNTYGMFLLPAISRLERKEKKNVWESVCKLNKENHSCHHAFILTPGNSSIHLKPDQFDKFIETFLMLFVISPFKYRLKNYLEVMRSTFSSSAGLPYFSAGIAMVDTSNDFHRKHNFIKSKNLFLKNICGLETDSHTIRDTAREYTKTFFLNASNFEPVLTNIASDLNKEKNEIFGGSLFRMIYKHMENMGDHDMENIYLRFDEFLRDFIFRILIKSRMNTNFVKLVLKNILIQVDEIYKQTEIDAYKNRGEELEKQYDRYLRRSFVRKLLNIIHTVIPFLPALSSDRKKADKTIYHTTLNFLRMKVLREFFDYTTKSFKDYIDKIDHAISEIADNNSLPESYPESCKAIDNSPFVIKLLKTQSDDSRHEKIFELLFDESCDYINLAIKKHIDTACSLLTTPVPFERPVAPDDAVLWLYESFQKFYENTLESGIYRDESETLVKYYSRSLKNGHDIKESLLQLSEPYITFYNQWISKPRLFYSTSSEKLNKLFDDYREFLNNNFIAEAFNDTSPWEIPVLQVDGPFLISDILPYKVLEDEFGKRA